MKKAIITGADGFIGHYLVSELLTSGYYVIGIGVDETKISNINDANFKFIKATFDDYDKLNELIGETDFDCFYHLAWSGVFGAAFKDFTRQLNNVNFACVALMQAIKLKCKKFVLASTINTLETRKYFSMEKIEPRFTNIYSMCKLSAEMICKTLAYQYGIEFNCGLISMVYGEGNYSMMVPNVVILNLLQNKESNLVPYNTNYDLIYVGDVAKAFHAIGEKGINQKTYYVGHPNISSFGLIFDHIKSIINKNGVLNYGVYEDKTMIDYSLIDTSSLFKDTGFMPTNDFDKTVASTAKWLSCNLKH